MPSALGVVIADQLDRHTLYSFSGDRHDRSRCVGPCTRVYAPALAPREPNSFKPVNWRHVGLTERPDHTRQLTYYAHPLYRFTGDTRPGELRGQGRRAFGGRWTAVSLTGRPAR